FEREEEYLFAINGGPWLFGKTSLHLAKWRLGLDMKYFSLNAFHVWVKLSDLALELWDVEVLKGIARAIGKLLVIDSSTLAMTKMTHARMCVNAQPGKLLPSLIRLGSSHGSVDQVILYELSPMVCGRCRTVGHDASSCSGSALEWRLKAPSGTVGDVGGVNPDPQYILPNRGERHNVGPSLVRALEEIGGSVPQLGCFVTPMKKTKTPFLEVVDGVNLSSMAGVQVCSSQNMNSCSQKDSNLAINSTLNYKPPIEEEVVTAAEDKALEVEDMAHSDEEEESSNRGYSSGSKDENGSSSGSVSEVKKDMLSPTPMLWSGVSFEEDWWEFYEGKLDNPIRNSIKGNIEIVLDIEPIPKKVVSGVLDPNKLKILDF
ncbi:hypothetical protein KI387_035286, partial [Taxus chinensis]